jgi:hypothetical protein
VLSQDAASLRFVHYLSFQKDQTALLRKVSKAFQIECPMPATIADGINYAIDNLRRVKKVCGEAESKVKLYCEGKCDVDMPGKDGWKKGSLQVVSDDEAADIKAHVKSKKRIINRLCDSFTTRYTKVLDDPIVQAFIIFDPGVWPEDPEKLAAWGVDEIQFLSTHYSKFFHGNDVELCIEQWGRLKSKIAKCPTLKSLKFSELWPRMLVHSINTFEIVLQLPAINLLFVMDNSQVERDFSDLNDPKDEFQSNMSHDVTAARLWWYKMKTSMTPERWHEAVDRIGHEWMKGRETSSGTRRAHNAAPPVDELAAQLVTVANNACAGVSV